MKSNAKKKAGGVKLSVILLLIVCVLLAIAGQIFLKTGMNQIGSINVKSLLSSKFFSIVFQKYVFIGIVCYFSGAMLWLVVLSQVDVSYAYPLLAISYVFVAIYSWIFFGENITTYRALGIILITIGAILINLKV